MRFARLRRAVIDLAAPNPDGATKDCYGRNDGLLRGLVREYNQTQLFRVLEYRPREHRVPKLVDWLCEQAMLDFPALPSVDELERRAGELQRKAATFAANGADDLAEQYEAQAQELLAAAGNRDLVPAVGHNGNS